MKKSYICVKCEKSLASPQSLWNHKQRCSGNGIHPTRDIVRSSSTFSKQPVFKMENLQNSNLAGCKEANTDNHTKMLDFLKQEGNIVDDVCDSDEEVDDAGNNNEVFDESDSDNEDACSSNVYNLGGLTLWEKFAVMSPNLGRGPFIDFQESIHRYLKAYLDFTKKDPYILKSEDSIFQAMGNDLYIHGILESIRKEEWEHIDNVIDVVLMKYRKQLYAKYIDARHSLKVKHIPYRAEKVQGSGMRLNPYIHQM